MAALLEGLSTIRTSVSADIFDANTNVDHKHKETSDNNGNIYVSSTVTLTPPHAINSKVDTTTPKMSILFNQLTDIKDGYFGKFESVDSQRACRETFCKNPILFPANQTNQNKTMVEK